MLNIIRIFSLGVLSCSCCVSGETVGEYYRTHKNGLVNAPQKEFKSTNIYKNIHADIKPHEDLNTWLNKTKLNIGEKSFLLDIPEKTRNEIRKKEDLKDEFFKAIKTIQEKDNIDNRVIGYNITLFNGKIYVKPFLGWNAK